MKSTILGLSNGQHPYPGSCLIQHHRMPSPLRCTAHCPGSGGLEGIISVTASLLGVKLVQAVWWEREELYLSILGGEWEKNHSLFHVS